MKVVLPGTVGLDQQRLGRVSAWLEQQVISKRVAGASLLICRHGHAAFFEVTGVARKESSMAFAEDTIVRIFSMTKPITTVAAMMLYERGCSGCFFRKGGFGCFVCKALLIMCCPTLSLTKSIRGGRPQALTHS